MNKFDLKKIKVDAINSKEVSAVLELLNWMGDLDNVVTNYTAIVPITELSVAHFLLLQIMFNCGKQTVKHVM